MRFVETPVFTKAITALLDDESYRLLQSQLMRRPEAGATIPAAGGARKARWVRAGAGKRGGIRVVYYWARGEETLYMLYAYSKSDQGDLTPKQAKVLAQLIREEFK
ncbi:MAG TPA: type II toxin-antitoxin system RelE/ParE family toxin [Vicinamibacterales bacterium]|nr:type II toxin-antitoxin system RelE/ParE family toxin [Vicinamibacterales bacterium]